MSSGIIIYASVCSHEKPGAKQAPRGGVFCARVHTAKKHEGKGKNICEINHLTYYRNNYGYEHVYRDLEQRSMALEKERVRLERREKKVDGGKRADEEKGDGVSGGNEVDRVSESYS